MRRHVTRCELLEGALACSGCALFLPRPALAQDPVAGLTFKAEQDFAPLEARFYDKLPDDEVACNLCPNHCRVPPGERGRCRVRRNDKGTYVTLVYGRVVAANVDPIEKKPFFHYRPGTTAFSIATAGCNFRCQFCQNWQISQFPPEEVRAMKLSPQRVHELAKAEASPTIAYTYNEPTVWFEFMDDCAALGAKTGLRSVVISNGFIEKEPLEQLLPHVDAVRYDLKSFRKDFYSRICGGELGAVLRSMERVKKAGKWLEIIHLVVPTLNDSDEETRELAKWVKSSLGPGVPVHFTRFHPDYKLRNLPLTPVSTIDRCLEIARAEGLDFPYAGNVAGHPGSNTTCPGCKTLLVERAGISLVENHLVNGACPKCKRSIPGVWA